MMSDGRSSSLRWKGPPIQITLSEFPHSAKLAEQIDKRRADFLGSFVASRATNGMGGSPAGKLRCNDSPGAKFNIT